MPTLPRDPVQVKATDPGPRDVKAAIRDPRDVKAAIRDPLDVKAAIRGRALAGGFDAVGFAPAALADNARDRLASFLAAGWHGDMGWLADTAPRRGDPQALWPAARAVVMLGVNYGPGEDPLAVLAHRDRGAVSVYARNRDYHDTVKKRLRALAMWMHQSFAAEVKIFVDTAPVMEKPLAALAGLGWQGKHSNLVSRGFGSWLFLGSVFTTLELPPDPPGRDHCGACQACLDICPTGAFVGPYRLDARRCVSYLTIEHKGPIPDALKPLMGNRIYGCDDCLAVCPWNKFAVPTREADFLPRIELTRPRLADLAALEDPDFRAVFAGSPIKRIGRDRLVRNVAVAIGNSADASLLPVVGRLVDDPAAGVADAARWAVERLTP